MRRCTYIKSLQKDKRKVGAKLHSKSKKIHEWDSRKTAGQAADTAQVSSAFYVCQKNKLKTRNVKLQVLVYFVLIKTDSTTGDISRIQ